MNTTIVIPKQKARSSASHMPTRICDTDRGKRYTRKGKRGMSLRQQQTDFQNAN